MQLIIDCDKRETISITMLENAHHIRSFNIHQLYVARAIGKEWLMYV